MLSALELLSCRKKKKKHNVLTMLQKQWEIVCKGTSDMYSIPKINKRIAIYLFATLSG